MDMVQISAGSRSRYKHTVVLTPACLRMEQSYSSFFGHCELGNEVRIGDTVTGRIPEASMTHLHQNLTKQINSKRRRTDYIETFKQGISGLIDIRNDQDAAEEFHSAWYLLIENYSRRNLTYETDRFAAMASMVYTMQHASGDKCLAGIWKQHIWRDLL